MRPVQRRRWQHHALHQLHSDAAPGVSQDIQALHQIRERGLHGARLRADVPGERGLEHKDVLLQRGRLQRRAGSLLVEPLPGGVPAIPGLPAPAAAASWLMQQSPPDRELVLRPLFSPLIPPRSPLSLPIYIPDFEPIDRQLFHIPGAASFACRNIRDHRQQ